MKMVGLLGCIVAATVLIDFANHLEIHSDLKLMVEVLVEVVVEQDL